MRITKTLAAAAAALLTATAAVPAVPELDALRAAGDAPLSIRYDGRSGKARALRTDGDLLAAERGDLNSKAKTFFDRHGAIMGLSGAAALRDIGRHENGAGTTTLSYEQVFRGIPVAGSWVKANFRRDGSLYAVSGDVVEALDIDTAARIDAGTAARRALTGVAAAGPFAGLRASVPELVIHRLYGRSNRDGIPMLAWKVEVANGRNVREFVFVDAHNGKLVDRYSGINEALHRRVYDGGFASGFLVWSEGDGTPFGSAPIDNLIEFSADTYDFFRNLSSDTFLSWDGVDGIMHAVNNDPGISCPNANWNGVSINFCNGTSSDDVVGHEWAHAYTESTHGLIYRWQSGALNESYSDIFGETIDRLNAAGNDSPAAPRSVGVCSNFGGNLPPTLNVLSPADVAGQYPVSGADFNPSSADVSASLRLVDDASGIGSDACEPVINDITGRVAMIDRGSCTFVTKVLNAQSAGAVGVLIINNAGEDLVNMGGSSAGITIPSVFIGQTDGEKLRNASTEPTVNVTIGGSRETSLRWLMGEDATAFGGAIRDMWEPRCMGDPGKVSDAEYHCNGDADNGGVHINSGVPNHAFALLVDGGNYNGVDVDAIGADKAAHIYWHAATHYQGPSSDFEVHADALEFSCDDLEGLALPTLSTEAAGPAGTVTIGSADCAAVAAAMAAVEMRDPPTRCNFQPLLQPDPPALCDAGSAAQTLLLADFESGLGDWSVGRRETAATFDGPDWSVVGSLPGGRSGMAAYGPDPILGDCVTDLETGIVFIESPAIVLSGSTDLRLAFDHNVMTEASYDGGNLKISVNGGAYTVVPSAAFTFNAYNGTLVASDNPMAGEAAFNGADDGTLESDWGQSQISLAGVAAPGSTVRLRFELGMDGCNGLDGWYLDDVRLYSCELATDTDGDSVPDPSDNCTEVANADQRDTDGDNYGNVCDADLDNNGTVEFNDLLQMRDAFFSSPGDTEWNEHADLNGDAIVNFADLDITKAQFFGPPGPSGLAP